MVFSFERPLYFSAAPNFRVQVRMGSSENEEFFDATWRRFRTCFTNIFFLNSYVQIYMQIYDYWAVSHHWYARKWAGVEYWSLLGLIARAEREIYGWLPSSVYPSLNGLVLKGALKPIRGLSELMAAMPWLQRRLWRLKIRKAFMIFTTCRVTSSSGR